MLIFLIVGIFAFSKSYTTAAIAVVNVGKISEYPPGTIKFINKAKTFVISDEEGIYAVSSVCTHLGCIINQKEKELVCPCHGAKFDISGKVLSGPAKQDLNWYHLELGKENNIILDTATAVNKGTKLPYPSK